MLLSAFFPEFCLHLKKLEHQTWMFVDVILKRCLVRYACMFVPKTNHKSYGMKTFDILHSYTF